MGAHLHGVAERDQGVCGLSRLADGHHQGVGHGCGGILFFIHAEAGQFRGFQGADLISAVSQIGVEQIRTPSCRHPGRPLADEKDFPDFSGQKIGLNKPGQNRFRQPDCHQTGIRIFGKPVFQGFFHGNRGFVDLF